MTTQKTPMDLLSESEGSVDEVLGALEKLRTELTDGGAVDWQNPTLERFLEAMQAWLRTMGPRVPAPSWKFVEIMLQAAKIYE